VDDTESAVTFLSQRLPGPIGAFGNSLGALVALHTAARDRRIRSIVASGCPARVRDFTVTPFRDRLLGALTAVDRVLPIRVSVNHFIPYRKILRTSRAIEQVRRDPLVKDARRFTPSTYADMFKWDALGVVREVRVPLLVLCATRDDFQPPEQSELLLEAARGHAELRTLDTGHLPAFEEPERVAPILHQWFGRTLRPPASDSPLPAGATDPDSSVAEDQSESSRLEDL
jgi:pimeloyl-ACP methyl ester carboxylesterase